MAKQFLENRVRQLLNDIFPQPKFLYFKDGKSFLATPGDSEGTLFQERASLSNFDRYYLKNVWLSHHRLIHVEDDSDSLVVNEYFSNSMSEKPGNPIFHQWDFRVPFRDKFLVVPESKALLYSDKDKVMTSFFSLENRTIQQLENLFVVAISPSERFYGAFTVVDEKLKFVVGYLQEALEGRLMKMPFAFEYEPFPDEDYPSFYTDYFVEFLSDADLMLYNIRQREEETSISSVAKIVNLSGVQRYFDYNFENIESFCFSPDKSLLAYSFWASAGSSAPDSMHFVSIVDVKTGQLLEGFSPYEVTRYPYSASLISLSPDNNYLACVADIPYPEHGENAILSGVVILDIRNPTVRYELPGVDNIFWRPPRGDS